MRRWLVATTSKVASCELVRSLTAERSGGLDVQRIVHRVYAKPTLFFSFFAGSATSVVLPLRLLRFSMSFAWIAFLAAVWYVSCDPQYDIPHRSSFCDPTPFRLTSQHHLCTHQRLCPVLSLPVGLLGVITLLSGGNTATLLLLLGSNDGILGGGNVVEQREETSLVSQSLFSKGFK